MPSVNGQLAALFLQMANVLEILGGDRFRINAFARAGRVIGELTDDLAVIGPDVKALSRLEGIGKGTAERIAEFLQTGKIADYDDMMAKVPDGLTALLDIQGLGPKKIAVLWNEAGVENLEGLKRKLQGDGLAKLAGFGVKTLDNLRKSVAFAAQSSQRVRIGQALPLACWFVQKLDGLKQVRRVQFAGSLRRGRETIGDIDLIVAAADDDRHAIGEAFVALEPVTEVLVRGDTKVSVRTAEGMQVDLRIVGLEHFGAALMYFTGSKEHNVRLRQRAIDMGMNLNEYALTQNDQLVASVSERDIYAALKLPLIAPPLREDRGEIAMAERGALPVLVQLGDVKAELHAHTTASDGRWSIRELAAAAAERGFHTVAVTDHSKGQAQAHGLDEKRLEKHITEVREVAAEVKDTITVLAGSEVDILADGSLDYPNSLLKELDIVVASPHAALTQSPEKATRRLLKAIHNRYVTILGHPTGRLVLRREGLSPDMKQLIAACAQRGIAMEINANHYRLDLRDTHARAAIEAGVKLAINTDAHGAADLDQLMYGVLTAQRAGATAADVVNCMGATALHAWIGSTRER